MLRRFRASLVVLVVAVTACSGGDGSPDASADADASSSSPGAGCEATTVDDATASASPAAAALEDVDHPLLVDVIVTSPEPIVPVVRVRGAGTVRDLAPRPADTEHRILVSGLRAEQDYEIEVAAFSADCADGAALSTLATTTGSLPEDLPEFVVTTTDAERQSPGYTLFDLLDLRADFGSIEVPEGEVPPPAGWIFIVDEAGEVVWYHVEPHPIGDVRMLADGTILFEFNDTAARRIDLRGNVLEEWASNLIVGRFALDAHGRRVVGEDPVVVDADSMHHEHLPLPDGTHAVISTELRVLDGFDEPLCGEDPATFDGTYHLVGDVIVLFDPDTGAVQDRFSLFDHFDPRTDPEALNLCGLPLPFVFPNWLYSGIDPAARDWTHSNGIAVDEANNALLVSIRHLDAVLALRWKADEDGPAGERLWQSGPGGDLELTAGDWHHHQHAPEVQADGSLLLYDNGNFRPGRGTPEAPLYSRAVLYDIDPVAGTVTQRWEHRSRHDGALVFAGFVGDADRLDNGNVLITDGGLNGNGAPGLDAQIVEVVPDLDTIDGAGNEVVFQLDVLGVPGWIVYRSERIPAFD